MLLKKAIIFFKENGLRGIPYLVIRILSIPRLFLLKNRLASCGVLLYIEKPYKILNHNHIYVGDRFHVYNNARIECITTYQGQTFNPRLIIGNNVTINNNIHIGVINRIIIEDNVLIASNVYITDHNHGSYGVSDPSLPPVERPLISHGIVVVRKNTWIGENVTILSGIEIGEGAIIGANSVVNKNIPKYAIAVGSPAKVVKIFNFEKQQWIRIKDQVQS